MSAPSRKRGPYAKTAEQRRRILEAAVDVFAVHGYRGSSLRDVADRVGMTQAGVLHHFGTKEGLLLAVLDHRDQRFPSTVGRPGAQVLETLRSTMVKNVAEPGLSRLFLVLAAEAADPEHPAHDFFATRYAGVRRDFIEEIEALRDAGEIVADVDAPAVAEQLVAVMDGLQIQWQFDQDMDLLAAFDRFVADLVARLATRA